MIRLRALAPGDIGWIIGAHGRLYSAQYGWDWSFEAYAAEVGRDFIHTFDPARAAGWIAEWAPAGGDSRPVGSAAIVPAGAAGLAKLRLVLVEPDFRGQGLGRRLVEAAENFARAAGYRAIELWTFSMLAEARALYARLGYRITATEGMRRFGHDLVEERWEKRLDPPGATVPVEATAVAKGLPGPAPAAPVLRPLRVGDIGWITAAHGRIYAAEQGWDWTFEGYVATGCANFVARFDPAKFAGWVLEIGDVPVGSALVQPGATRQVAALQALLVEPAFRGRGLGRRLVEAAEAFARSAGYTRMELQTFEGLTAARALYASMGYTLTSRQPPTRFGPPMVEERWERVL
jgi:GNAT superfamily N-acetyltransferase